MKHESIFGIAAFSVFASLMMAGAPAQAESVEDFYRGKTMELIVGFTPGGGYDRYARVLARHMGRHIPGNPAIVVKNMPGAGSLVAANHLYVAAPKDGTMIGAVSRDIAFMPLLSGDEGVEFEADRFNWIGSLNNEVSICVSWHATAVKTWKDLQETELVVAGTSPESATSIYPQVLNTILGAKVRVITGYPGTSEMLLALERGEVDGICAWSWSSVKKRKSEWLKDGKVNILVQTALQKHPDLPDVPLVMDLAKTEEQRQMLRLVTARQMVGRPFAAPPGVPEDRVQALREAFEATAADADFLADAKKSKVEINVVSGEAVGELLRTVYATPKNVVAMTREAIKR